MISFSLFFVFQLLFNCTSELNPEQEPGFKCGYGGETIMVIQDESFQIDGLEVIVSGDSEDNPSYSSHTYYTDFYIPELFLAGT